MAKLNIRRVVVLVGVLLSGGVACGVLATGCGGDDTGAPGTDGQADGSQTDSPALDVGRESAPDSITGDAPADSTTSDAPADNTVGDAPPENASDAITEASLDGGPDAAADVGSDGQDAAPDSAPDGESDGGSDVDAGAAADAAPDTAAEFAFPDQLATAICQQIALCCFPDGGTSTFDMGACVTHWAGMGFDNSSYGTYALSNGNIAFDPDAGAACLNAVNSIAGTCTVTAAIEQQIIPNCFGALVGMLDAGASCTASMECAPGNVCVPPSDGGSIGACAALRAAGQPCGDIGTANYSLGSQFCSYRGSGDTGLFCMETDDAGGQIPTSSWTCQPQLSLTSAGLCYYDTDCVSPMLCDDFTTGNCLTASRPLTTMMGCSAYVDAGSD